MARASDIPGSKAGRAAVRRPGLRRTGVGVVGLLALALVVGVGASATAGATPTTVTAAADSFVASNKQKTNYGRDTALHVEASPTQRAYFKFIVPSLSGPIGRATLRLYSSSSTPGYDVRTAGNGWTETGITYANAPAPSAAAIGSSGPLSAGQWSSVDVTSQVTPGGTFTFVATTTSNTLSVLASRETGSATAPELVVEPATPPQNTSPPTVSGTAQEGQTLTASPGSWSAFPSPTYAYQWQRCDSGGSGCTDIASATSSSYTLASGDVGSTVRATVTATNSAGSASASSDPTAVVVTGAPQSTSPPTVSGTPQEGQTLAATTGSWSGSPTTYAYQWQRCDGGGSGCTDIASATASSYTLVSDDVGSTLRATVTATNSFGSGTASSDATAVVARAPVIAAAGDIACDPLSANFNNGAGTATACHMNQTAALVSALSPDAVLTLGDNQYECAPLAAFQQSYALSWGQFLNITDPIVGNHEYQTDSNTGVTHTPCDNTQTAAGYFAYYGAQAGTPGQGYYSYDIGSWHLIALNSECQFVGGCGLGSPEEQWLKNDLAAHPAACTLAYWHEPRWSSGVQGNLATYDAFWQDLYAAHAEIVLNGHMHLYERFAPQDPSGQLDTTNGIREFTVGTGGKSLVSFSSVVDANSEVRNNNTYGVLELKLLPTSYEWKFLPEAGQTFTDSGSQACH